MTMDEITIKINLAAEDVETELNSVISSLQSFAKNVQSENGTAADSYKALAAVAGDTMAGIHKAVVGGLEARSAYAAATNATDALAESQAKAAKQSQLTAQAFGDAMTPTVRAGTEMMTGFMGAIESVTKAAPGMTAGVTTAAGAFSALMAGLAKLSSLKTLLGGAVALKALLGPIGAVAAGLGVVAGAYTAVKNSQEVAAEAEAERIKANREAIVEQQSRVERLAELMTRYKELAGKQELGFAEEQEVAAIQRELADAYGVTAGSVNELTDSMRDYLGVLSETQKKELDVLLAKQKEASQQAYLKTYAPDVAKAYKDAANAAAELHEAEKALSSGSYIENGISKENAEKRVEIAEAEYERTSAILKQYEGLYVDWAKAAAEESITTIIASGGKVNEALGQALIDAFEIDLSQFDGNQDAANGFVDAWVKKLKEILSNPAVGDALSGMQDVVNTAMQGLTPSTEQIEAFSQGWEYLTGEGSPLMTMAGLLADDAEDATEVAGRLIESLLGLGDGMMLIGENGEAFSGTVEDSAYYLEGLAAEMERAGAVTGEYAEEINGLISDTTKLQRSVGDIASLNKNINAYKDAKKAYENARKSGKDLDKTFDGMQQAAKKLGVNIDKGSGSVKDMDKAMKTADKSVAGLEKEMAADGASIMGTLQSMLSQAQATETELNIQAAMGVDVSQPLAAIQSVIKLILWLISLMGAAGIAPSGGGGGGGGGGGRDESADAERAAREAERARQEAIQRDYDIIEHKRHMQEITLEEELAMIEKIRTAHRLNAEEIMEWEEKIYDLKKEIRERDAESIDTLADGVVAALENRYEAMRDAEVERLDKSREAWEQWRDDSVAAIEDQIAALDKLSETEDREAKDAEELRKIEKLRREIEYEQDDYNRMKLQQQLDKALESRDERLRKLALSDQKDALREEIDRINDKTDEQLDALDKEQEAIKKAYEERLKEAAINAEAEKLLMTKSQDELMDLLYEYVPEYNALGQTMGEKLLDGFKSKVGDVVAWFKDFNEGLYQMQEQLASMSNAAADSFYTGYEQRQDSGAAGVTVNQTVQFYEPVESPSQIAQRMEDVNDALGELLG